MRERGQERVTERAYKSRVHKKSQRDFIRARERYTRRGMQESLVLLKENLINFIGPDPLNKSNITVC